MRVLTGGYRTQPGSRLQVLAGDGTHHDRWTGVLTAAASLLGGRKVFPAGGIGWRSARTFTARMIGSDRGQERATRYGFGRRISGRWRPFLLQVAMARGRSAVSGCRRLIEELDHAALQ